MVENDSYDPASEAVADYWRLSPRCGGTKGWNRTLLTVLQWFNTGQQWLMMVKDLVNYYWVIFIRVHTPPNK